MKQVIFNVVILISLVTNSFGWTYVNRISHEVPSPGKLVVYINADTQYGEGVAAEAMWDGNFKNTRDHGTSEYGSFIDGSANWKVTWNDNILPSSGQVEYQIMGIGGDNNFYSHSGFNWTVGDMSLPVTLSSFTATQSKGVVTLNWTTESETNNRGFNVYCSETENGNYTQINSAMISGAGNSTTANDYSFTHKNVIAGRTYWYKLEDVSVDGKSEMHGPVSVKIEESASVNEQYTLSNCYPNPFNPVTTINYTLPEKSNVNIMVYDVNGNLVKLLKSSKQDAGNYSVQWDGTDLNNNMLGAGVYFCKMTTNTGFNQTTKMILVK